MTMAPATDVYKRAMVARKARNFGEALRLFDSLLNADPMTPDLAIPYAECLIEAGSPGLAYHMLANLQPFSEQHSGLMGNLGVALAKCGLREEARTVYQRAVQKHPDDWYSWANLGAININRGTPDEAIAACDKCLEVKPGFQPALWSKALALLELGRLGEGWDMYESGLDTEGPGGGPHRLTRHYHADRKTPFWDGAPGKKVVVYGEQGLGDEIMFASIIPELVKDCREVVYDCHDRMVGMMRRSFPDVTVVGTRKQTEYDWPVLMHDIDAQLPLGSLGKFYRREVAAFPNHAGYIKPDPARVKALRQKLESLPGKGPIVGIAWHGGHDTYHQSVRSIPLLNWGPVLKQPCRFVSVQYSTQEKGRPNPTRQGLEAALQGVAHWQSTVDNFEELTALIAACDLVISNNQTATHQAGGLGKECWTLTPARHAWRYSAVHGDVMPWYPSVKVMRQLPEEQDWSGLMNRVGAELRHYLGLNGVDHAGSDEFRPDGLPEVRA